MYKQHGSPCYLCAVSVVANDCAGLCCQYSNRDSISQHNSQRNSQRNSRRSRHGVHSISNSDSQCDRQCFSFVQCHSCCRSLGVSQPTCRQLLAQPQLFLLPEALPGQRKVGTVLSSNMRVSKS